MHFGRSQEGWRGSNHDAGRARSGSTDTDGQGPNKCSNRHFSFVEIIGAFCKIT